MTPAKLDEIEAAVKAATKGPWWWDESENCMRLHGVHRAFPPLKPGLPDRISNKQILKAPKHGTPYAEYWPDPEDALAIVILRNNADDLLREARFGVQARAEMVAFHNSLVRTSAAHFSGGAVCCAIRAFLAAHPEGT